MNIEFYDSHLETLCELKNIAKKHGYTISFGVASSNDEMVEKELFQENGFTDEEIEAIDTILETTNHMYSDEKIWFQLSNKNEVNQLIYHVNSNYVTIKKDFDTFTSEELTDIGVDEDELIQKLDNHDEFLDYDEYTLNFSSDATYIYGFGNKEPVKNHLVYRNGMALKYFGDYVCDYLGEPRIERTY